MFQITWILSLLFLSALTAAQSAIEDYAEVISNSNRLSSVFQPEQFGMDFYSCVLKQDKLLTSKSNSPCYKSFYSDASTACLCTYHSAVYDKCGPMLSNDSPALNFILFLNSQGVCCLEQTKDKLFCESEIKKVDKFLEMFEKILEVSGLGNLVTKLDKFGVIPTSEENNNFDEEVYEFDESVRLPELEKRGIFFQRESNRNNRRKNKYGKPIRSNHKLKNNKNSKVSEVKLKSTTISIKCQQ
ncbi:unnamed protein product [[Candida] boidinii]|nr:unnamed protein product [[Candida] boidinii]